MPNVKINQLTTTTTVANTDLAIVGDPSTGLMKQTTVSVLAPRNAETGLTDSSTISWNYLNGNVSNVVLGGNRMLNIVNAPTVSFGVMKVTQDGTGSRTLTLPPGSATPTGFSLSTSPGITDVIGFYFDGATYFWSIEKGYSTSTSSTTSTSTSSTTSTSTSSTTTTTTSHGSTTTSTTTSTTSTTTSSTTTTTTTSGGLTYLTWQAIGSVMEQYNTNKGLRKQSGAPNGFANPGVPDCQGHANQTLSAGHALYAKISATLPTGATQLMLAASGMTPNGNGYTNIAYGFYSAYGLGSIAKGVENAAEIGTTFSIAAGQWLRLVYTVGSISYQFSADGVTWVTEDTSATVPSGAYDVWVQSFNALAGFDEIYII